jgi:hypothetical protein
VMWGIWDNRDLTSGDTTHYFAEASRWTDHLHLDPLWSPMYTFFWGSLQWIVPDPFAVTTLHRVLIATAASLLVLAVLRRLLTPGIAWALAAWWAILPVNFDTLYEVHLFALLPELAAVLIALTWSGLRMRSAVFGVLLATTVLMRNELIVAVVIWAAVWMGYEVSRRRRGVGVATSALIKAAAVPVLAVTVLTALVVLSWPDRAGLSSRSEEKHTVNLCQIYAFGYEQRHHDYTASPWTDCEPLMQRDFGRSLPTLTEAIEANPGAMMEHFLWNVRLSPYAFQLQLFNRISADPSHNPDYAPVKTGSVASRIGLVVVALFLAGGVFLLWRDRRRWWDDWVRRRAWGWLALGALGASAVVVLVWQRPRPSYLFALAVLLFAAIGMCAMAYADRWRWLNRLAAAPPVAAILLIAAVPSHYGADYWKEQQVGRPGLPLKTMVDRLHPLRDELRGEDVHLLGSYAGAGCFYIGGAEPCTPVTWDEVLNRALGTPPALALAQAGVDFVYVDRVDLLNPAFAATVDAAEAVGWRRVAGEATGDRWELLERPGLGTERAS